MSGVLLIAEASGGQPSPTLLEVVSEGQRLAEQLNADAPVLALLGANVQGVGDYGVARVLVADSGTTKPPSSSWLLAAAEAAARQVQPEVILVSHLGAGRELGPALAYRLETGIVTDCTALRIDGVELVITKPVYGGSATAEYTIATTPKVASLRPRAFEATVSASPKVAQVETLSVPEVDDRIHVLEEVREEGAVGPRLKDAKVVVSGGRGLGGPDNWRYIDELAKVLGAAVGATRAVTDAGWVPPSHQVGLTGATIAPDLYITIGISGAVQHIAGIAGARNVVAINRDADANIFKYARFGVVGDWKQVVPAFTERLKELSA